ncbi:zeta toxin family protein [Aquisphaera insulae]|uniref:zeta toxin family protein n=1 Tax=Aquisphaera insulae TaxID=2712864 RepID=UPI0013ED2555|nr:zeta toxin family protein [Aquisphaera insulae]
MDAIRSPIVYVIGGPNGAGKTTFATEYLPGFVDCREFVNADLIAAGLSPFAPETQAIRAGRLMLSRIAELREDRRDFGFETTLAGRAHIKLLADLKQTGYRVVLFFLWLPDADIAVRRVANRVLEGGHNVPEATIRRRFEAGLRNFFREYAPRSDAWSLYDGTAMPPARIASHDAGSLQVFRPESYRAILDRWGGGADA